MDWNADQIKQVQNTLDDLIREHGAKIQELEATQRLLANVPERDIELMDSAISSARAKRRGENTDTQYSMKRENQRLTQKIMELEVAAGRMWSKIGELQVRQKELEKAEKTKGKNM